MKTIVSFIVFGIMTLTLTVYAGGRKGGSRGISTPIYYTANDLENITRSYSSGIWYDNFSDSINADVAYMPSGIVDSGTHIASTWKTKNTSKISATHSGYIKRSGATKESATTRTPLWFGSNPISIDWDYMSAQKGDIIFIRSNTFVGKAVHLISSWTHTGIIYNKGQHEVFDSMDYGADIRNTDQEWGKVLAYGTKGARAMSSSQKERLADWAKDRYRFKPYFPKIDKNSVSNIGFLERWSRKDNLESVYCSKLVWLAFYEYARIDLDSNRTKWLNGNLSNRDNSWIGVSPDDIWGSNETTAAYDLVRVDMLTTPTSGL